MEFTIDFASVRKITKQEYRQARMEIKEVGAIAAYQNSLQRHDERLATASDADTLACKAGCSWCCYFSVDVRPVEIFNILNFVENELTPPEQQRVRSEIEVNNTLLKQLTEDERIQHNIKCPFLLAGKCSIYAARPQTCRNYHATNAAGCQQSFEEPNNLDIDPEYAPLVFQAGGAHVDAFSKAMLDEGYNIDAFELNTALAITMAQPTTTRQRFDAKLSPFAELPGTDVPLEFMD